MLKLLNEFNTLTKSGRLVLLGILNKYGYITPSMNDYMLADELGLTKITFSRGLRELKSRGFIEDFGFKSYKILFRLEWLFEQVIYTVKAR